MDVPWPDNGRCRQWKSRLSGTPPRFLGLGRSKCDHNPNPPTRNLFSLVTCLTFHRSEVRISRRWGSLDLRYPAKRFVWNMDSFDRNDLFHRMTRTFWAVISPRRVSLSSRYVTRNGHKTRDHTKFPLLPLLTASPPAVVFIFSRISPSQLPPQAAQRII
jgi:hypothetical protein